MHPRSGPRSALQHDVGIEHRDQPVEVPIARGREEGLDDLALSVEVGVGDGVLSPYASAGTARQLARRLGGAVDDRRDLVEGHREDVVQHERKPLGRAQRLEHDEQRKPDRVGQQRLVLGVGAVDAVDDRLGQVHARAAPRAAIARAQHVQRDARDDGRQPAAEVLDLARRRSG